MQKETWNKIGLAGAILLMPGGFILGATLAARHYRNGGFSRRKQPELPPAE